MQRLLPLRFLPLLLLVPSRGFAQRGPVGDLMPRSLTDHEWAGLEVWQWIGGGVGFVLSIVLGVALGRLLARAVLVAVSKARRKGVEPRVAHKVRRLQAPMQAAIALACFGVAMTALRLPDGVIGMPANVYEVAWVLAGGWLFVRIVDLIAEHLGERALRIEGGRGRGIRTRISIIRQVVNVVGITVLVAVALMQVGPVRDVGVSMLASAGVAGIVVGLAAQRSIGNLLAGIQLSFTQPLRVGDEVVIETQFGTVEEINLTYVVVWIWDQRRLIVPMTKLLESPFENWTRGSTELLGEVKVPVDFQMPVRDLRAKVEKFVRAHPLFDGRTFNLQVTDMKDRSAEVRVLVSAKDSGKMFDLRCAVREFMLETLQGLEGGRYLPRVRVDDRALAADAAELSS